MSRNLADLITRHEEALEQNAIALLDEARERDGEITREAMREVAEKTGLPEATVYGITTYYDDFLRPFGRREICVCTGTACWEAGGREVAAGLEAGLGLEMGTASEDGSVSLSETVCLGLCHCGPAVLDGDTVDAGEGVVDRVLAGEPRPAPKPSVRSLLDRPAMLRDPDWDGLRTALASHTPESFLEEVAAADLRGRGGAWFPSATKWRFVRDAPGERKYVVVNGDEGDPGSYIDKYLMEETPEVLLEGMALAGWAIGATTGVILVRSEYPDSTPILREAVQEARAANLLGEDILGSGLDFDVAVVEGAGSYVVGEETALINSAQGLRGTVRARPPFPAQRGFLNSPTLVHNVETLCAVPFIGEYGGQAHATLSDGEATGGTKLVCFNEAFAEPGILEVPFGMTVREICEAAGGLRDGGEIKAVQIGGPLGGILPASLLDTRFERDDLAAVGCMVGHGSILAFDQETDMRELCVHLLHFGADESCGTCFPCRIGLRRALEMAQADGPIDRDSLAELLDTLEKGSLCGHGSGMPAPIRSLMEHYPEELGLS